jgi:hypothetical protein
MMTSLPTTVARLDARLHEQMLEVATLRLAVDIQAMRIAHTQPDPFTGSHRRQSLQGLWRRARAHRGNGRIES